MRDVRGEVSEKRVDTGVLGRRRRAAGLADDLVTDVGRRAGLAQRAGERHIVQADALGCDAIDGTVADGGSGCGGVCASARATATAAASSSATITD